MLEISAKGYYGLAALFHLALNYNKGPVLIKEIARRQNIPQNYLEQLLVRLKNFNFVKSFRGKKGGYALCAPPSHINVLDVLTSLEGDLRLIRSCVQSEVLRLFFNKVEKNIKGLFDQSLEDLILTKHELGQKLMYNI
ncbi:MAG: Rrf2 family transcriptional regulator [Spirochaetes bacterium]|nr:Rrf2 family transcriptional regulator [Spirochaetota bacterium]